MTHCLPYRTMDPSYLLQQSSSTMYKYKNIIIAQEKKIRSFQKLKKALESVRKCYSDLYWSDVSNVIRSIDSYSEDDVNREMEKVQSPVFEQEYILPMDNLLNWKKIYNASEDGTFTDDNTNNDEMEKKEDPHSDKETAAGTAIPSRAKIINPLYVLQRSLSTMLRYKNIINAQKKTIRSFEELEKLLEKIHKYYSSFDWNDFSNAVDSVDSFSKQEVNRELKKIQSPLFDQRYILPQDLMHQLLNWDKISDDKDDSVSDITDGDDGNDLHHSEETTVKETATTVTHAKIFQESSALPSPSSNIASVVVSDEGRVGGEVGEKEPRQMQIKKRKGSPTNTSFSYHQECNRAKISKLNDGASTSSALTTTTTVIRGSTERMPLPNTEAEETSNTFKDELNSAVQTISNNDSCKENYEINEQMAETAETHRHEEAAATAETHRYEKAAAMAETHRYEEAAVAEIVPETRNLPVGSVMLDEMGMDQNFIHLFANNKVTVSSVEKPTTYSTVNEPDLFQEIDDFNDLDVILESSQTLTLLSPKQPAEAEVYSETTETPRSEQTGKHRNMNIKWYVRNSLKHINISRSDTWSYLERLGDIGYLIYEKENAYISMHNKTFQLAKPTVKKMGKLGISKFRMIVASNCNKSVGQIILIIEHNLDSDVYNKFVDLIQETGYHKIIYMNNVKDITNYELYDNGKKNSVIIRFGTTNSIAGFKTNIVRTFGVWGKEMCKKGNSIRLKICCKDRKNNKYIKCGGALLPQDQFDDSIQRVTSQVKLYGSVNVQCYDFDECACNATVYSEKTDKFQAFRNIINNDIKNICFIDDIVYNHKDFTKYLPIDHKVV